jgi:hypothetical protein
MLVFRAEVTLALKMDSVCSSETFVSIYKSNVLTAKKTYIDIRSINLAAGIKEETVFSRYSLMFKFA